MNIIFISRYCWPHVGGVEKHIFQISKILKLSGYPISIISSDGNGDYNIKYPTVKYLGLLKIWLSLFKIRNLIVGSDIIHIHDVFIWYLPFKIMFPDKKVYTTFHGWEGVYPIPFLNKVQKKVAVKLSNGTISVGNYINKWYGVKSNYVTYGAAEKNNNVRYPKTSNSIVFLGRLEQDTGVLEFIKDIKNHKFKKITFLGKGSLSKECSKYGKVVGFTNPTKYLERAEFVVPGGYLSYLEAKSFNCKIITYANNPLKENYWNEIKKLNKIPNWNEVAAIYVQLWRQ